MRDSPRTFAQELELPTEKRRCSGMLSPRNAPTETPKGPTVRSAVPEGSVRHSDNPLPRLGQSQPCNCVPSHSGCACTSLAPILWSAASSSRRWIVCSTAINPVIVKAGFVCNTPADGRYGLKPAFRSASSRSWAAGCSPFVVTWTCSGKSDKSSLTTSMRFRTRWLQSCCAKRPGLRKSKRSNAHGRGGGSRHPGPRVCASGERGIQQVTPVCEIGRRHCGSRLASRSAIQRSLLFGSISFQVFFPERVLSTADETSDVIRVQCERGGNLLIGEVLAAQEQ
jgi:hypothetical protein